MKIKIGKKVYLQKYEVAFIMHELESFPASIFDEVMKGNKFFSVNGPDDALKFGCVFTKNESVEWLMEQDWIVDYDRYAETPIPELQAIIELLMGEHNAEVEKFNSRSEKYRISHYNKANEDFGKKAHKIMSLRDMVAARKGDVTFTFPNGYE